MLAWTIEAGGEVNNILMKIPSKEFILVCDEWKGRLRECINRAGGYIEINQLSSLDLVCTGQSYCVKGLSAPLCFRDKCHNQCGGQTMEI
jgi:hypothetical protein